MASRKRDWAINRDAMKALVAVFGPREAARQSKVPWGTMISWCRRYKWKKADHLIRTNGINGDIGLRGPDPAEAIVKALQDHREKSTIHLAEYTRKASKQASKLADPLAKAHQVRHVAQVYSVLYPPEQGGELLEGGILVGALPVTDNPQEMLAAAEILPDAEHFAAPKERSSVRQELPDQRPQSD